MLNVEIHRFQNHPSGALGRISYGGPEGPWHIVVDKNGHPHLVMKVHGGWTEYFNFVGKDGLLPHEVIDCTPDSDETPVEFLCGEDHEEAAAEYAARGEKLVVDGCFSEPVCLVGLAFEG